MPAPLHVYAIVPAAGSGSRMGSQIPKLLLPLAGRTLIEHTLAKLASGRLIDRVILMVPEDRQEDFRRLDFDLPIPVDITPGGATRRESVLLGLRALAGLLPDSAGDPLVLVHDGARCFVSEAVVRRCICAARLWGAVTAAVPSIDSMKRVSAEGIVQESLERSSLWCVQTPQVFRWSLLRRAHEEALEEATDDASLVERIHQVRVVEGDRMNFKITSPEDLHLAEMLLRGDGGARTSR